MRKIIINELNKLWRKKAFLIGAASLIMINFFLLVMNSRIQEDSYADAYKKIGQELSCFSTMEEKEKFIKRLFDRIDGVYTVDQIFRVESEGISNYSRELRKENEELLKNYKSLYLSGNYLIYTENLQQEYLFLTQIKQEFDAVNQYPEYLKQIQEKAKSLSQISIFKTAEGNSFSEKCIQAQARAYACLNNVQTDYLPEKGIVSALEFRLSDILLVAAVLLMASVLLREEKDNGMLAFTFSFPRGRAQIAFAKTAAVMASLFVFVCCLYSTNLLYYHSIYGLGRLDRAIQSLPSLLACVWPVSAGEYLIAFIMAKWLGAAVFAAWIMLCTYLAKNIYTGWGIGFLFIGLNFFLYIFISGIGHWNFFKYVNLFGFINTNEWLGTYIQLYCFGAPVPILFCGIFGAAVLLILFLSALICLYHKGLILYHTRIDNTFSIALRGKRRMKRHENVWFRFFTKRMIPEEKKFRRLYRHESYKLLKMNGAIWVFVAFGVYIMLQCLLSKGFMSLEEELYRAYMFKFGGRVTEETVALLQEENKKFQPLYDLEDAFSMGILTSQEYENALGSYSYLQMEKKAYDSVAGEKLDYVARNEGAWLVYDTGYRQMFDIDSSEDIYEMMLLFLVLLLGFGGMFSVEKMTGMENILAVAPLGGEFTSYVKLRLSFRWCCVLSILSLLPRYVRVGKIYGFPELLAPAKSLEFFSGVWGWVGVYHMMLMQLLFRIFAACLAVCVIHYLSVRLKNTLIVFFVSALVLEMSPVLYLCGLEDLKWLSLWPCFCFLTLIAEKVPFLLLILYGVTFLGVFIWTRDRILGKEVNYGKHNALFKNHGNFLWRRAGKGRRRL